MNRTLNLIDGVQLVGASINPRYDLLRAYVDLTFETVNVENGFPQFTSVDQVWPVPPPSAFKGLDATIRLIGSNIQVTTALVRTFPFPALADRASLLTLLLRKHPALKDTETVQSVAVVSDATRSSTRNYGYFLAPDSAQITDWMTKQDGSTVNTSRDVLTMNVQVTSTNGHVEKKVMTVELTSTDLNTGGLRVTERKVSGSPTQEFPPPNLAEDMYDALSVLQYDGAVTLAPVLGECDTDSVWLGDVLSLGDVPKYSAMDAVVQSVSLDIDSGRTTVKVGPNRLLTAGDYIELLRVTRYRVVLNDATAKNASLEQSNSTNIGTASAIENSAGGAGYRQTIVASENADGTGGRVTHDSGEASITVEVDKDQLIKMLYDDAQGQQIRLRIYNVCVPDGSGGTTTKKAILLGSLPF